MENSPNLLKKVPFKDIIDQYESFFFDCDGVVFNGSSYLKETYLALDKLKEMGKNIFFVSNTSNRSRKDLMKKINGGGDELPVVI